MKVVAGTIENKTPKARTELKKPTFCFINLVYQIKPHHKKKKPSTSEGNFLDNYLRNSRLASNLR